MSKATRTDFGHFDGSDTRLPPLGRAGIGRLPTAPPATAASRASGSTSSTASGRSCRRLRTGSSAAPATTARDRLHVDRDGPLGDLPLGRHASRSRATTTSARPATRVARPSRTSTRRSPPASRHSRTSTTSRPPRSSSARTSTSGTSTRARPTSARSRTSGGPSAPLATIPASSHHTFEITDAWNGLCSVCHADANGDPKNIRVIHTLDYDGDGDTMEPLAAEIAGLAATHAGGDAGGGAGAGALLLGGRIYPNFFVDTNGDKTCSATEAVSSNAFNGLDARAEQGGVQLPALPERPGILGAQLRLHRRAPLRQHAGSGRRCQQAEAAMTGMSGMTGRCQQKHDRRPEVKS